LRAGHRQPTDPTCLDVRQSLRHGIEIEVDIAADQRGLSIDAALLGHVGGVDAG
jgi:hypothetical protein